MRRDLMDILACPVCKTELTLTVDREEEKEIIEGSLHCANCDERYPVSDGIPNLLEFALGLDPFGFNTLPSPTINASGNLTISVTKGAEATSDPKTSYFAQSSTDAINWSDTSVSVVTDNETTFTAEYTGNTSMALLRIGISVAE